MASGYLATPVPSIVRNRLGSNLGSGQLQLILDYPIRTRVVSSQSGAKLISDHAHSRNSGLLIIGSGSLISTTLLFL